jgi:DNA-damage-inducible protein J
MASKALVRARVPEDIKEEAAAVLAEMGLTVSDAVRILLARIAKERGLPFDLKPNRLTEETLKKSERGEDIHQAH